MKKYLKVLLVISILLSFTVISYASEVDWQQKVELYVPAKAGGGTDLLARTTALGLTKTTDKNVAIINSTAGNGVVALEQVRTARPNGGTLLFYHTTMLIQSASGVYDKDAVDDFNVIAVGELNNDGGYSLVVPADSFKTLNEFVSHAKENPEKILLGVQTGGTTHVMAGLIENGTGIDLKLVEAGSDTEKLTSLVGNNIDAALVNSTQAVQYAEDDRINVLAVISNGPEGGRNDLLPEVKSFVEQGFEDVYFSTKMFVLGPKDMEDELAKKIHSSLKEAVQDNEVKKRLKKANFLYHFKDFEEGRDLLKDTTVMLNNVVKDLGIEM